MLLFYFLLRLAAVSRIIYPDAHDVRERRERMSLARCILGYSPHLLHILS